MLKKKTNSEQYCVPLKILIVRIPQYTRVIVQVQIEHETAKKNLWK